MLSRVLIALAFFTVSAAAQEPDQSPGFASRGWAEAGHRFLCLWRHIPWKATTAPPTDPLGQPRVGTLEPVIRSLRPVASVSHMAPYLRGDTMVTLGRF